jgi:hypothetical protein
MGGDTVTVAGDRELTLRDAPAVRERFGWERRAVTIDCHSGRTIEGVWRGVPVAPAVEAAGFPPETTHLRATARDGHQVCVPVRTGLAGLLGFVCEELDDGREGTGGDTAETPRLVAPDIDSARAVRGLTRVEPAALPPDEDPRGHETVG